MAVLHTLQEMKKSLRKRAAIMLHEELAALDTRITNAESGVVAAGSISSTELENGAVIEGKLGTGAVTAGKLGTGAVTSLKIAADAVTYDKLDATGRTIILRSRKDSADALAATDFEYVIGSAYVTGNITAVKFIPDAGFGQDTNNSTLALYNRKADDSGTTAVAAKIYTAANAVVARVASSLGVSAVPADVAVAPGDVLTIKKTHTGNGQIVPAGVFSVTIVRTA